MSFNCRPASLFYRILLYYWLIDKDSTLIFKFEFLYFYNYYCCNCIEIQIVLYEVVGLEIVNILKFKLNESLMLLGTKASAVNIEF